MADTDRVEEVLESIRIAEAHIDTEYVDDHEGTLASVSRKPRYALMAAPGVVRIVTDSAGVASYYEEAREAFVPEASRIIGQIATDWYVFLNNVPTRHDRKTGTSRTLHTATLFPKAADGIRGEFLWARDPDAPLSDFKVDHADGPVPHVEVRNLQIHETFLRNFVSRDWHAIDEQLSEKCIWVERNYLPDAPARPMIEAQGPGETLASLKRWSEHFKLERVSILNRMVTEWYVFAEELFILRVINADSVAPLQQYRRAVIYPIGPDGMIDGLLSYGTDPGSAPSLADRPLGAAFWERLEPGEVPGQLVRRR